MRSVVIVLVAWATLACGSPDNTDIQPSGVYADLVIRGGPVITVDPVLGTQQAVAITGHTITAVGSVNQIAAYIGPHTEFLELRGRTLVPGFIEGHGHFLGLGQAQRILDLTTADSFSDVVARVGAAADAAAPGAWILGRGWHQDKWQAEAGAAVDGVPVNTPMNSAAPDNPVFLGHASGHAAYVNDAALAAAGVVADTPDPSGGTIVRDESGRATGLLREKAQQLVQGALARYQSNQPLEHRQREFRERVRLAGNVALRFGVTSFHDAGAPLSVIDAFKELEAAGQLPVRLYVMVRGESLEEMARRLPDYFLPYEDNDFLTVRSIKRQIDGALGAHGAWLLEPYEDLPESTGLVLESVDDIEATARLAVEHGFQLNTHAIGTRANRETLDLYQRAWQTAGVDGSKLRWRIEHAQHLHPEDVPRFGELGVIAAIQGVHCTSDGPWLASRLGEARTAATSYRWRDLIDSGARLNNGTDVPVEHINPLASYHASIARVMNNGEAFYPTQAMTRMEALKSYTLDNAYSGFEEDHKGSITPGKLADLVVLSQDILSVAEARLADTVVEVTIVGGEIRFLAE